MEVPRWVVRRCDSREAEPERDIYCGRACPPNPPPRQGQTSTSLSPVFVLPLSSVMPSLGALIGLCGRILFFRLSSMNPPSIAIHEWHLQRVQHWIPAFQVHPWQGTWVSTRGTSSSSTDTSSVSNTPRLPSATQKNWHIAIKKLVVKTPTF